MINAWVYLVVGVLGIIITVTLIGCLLTIVAIWTRPVLRKLVNVPLASLSCADILFTIFGPALWIPVFLHPGWEPPGALCWFQGYLNPVLWGVSVSHMMCIALQRYFMVCTNSTRLTSKRVLFSMLFLTWLVSIIAYLPLHVVEEVKLDPKFKRCSLGAIPNILGKFIPMFITIIIPYITALVCYISIYNHVRKSKKRVKANNALLPSNHLTVKHPHGEGGSVGPSTRTRLSTRLQNTSNNLDAGVWMGDNNCPSSDEEGPKMIDNEPEKPKRNMVAAKLDQTGTTDEQHQVGQDKDSSSSDKKQNKNDAKKQDQSKGGLQVTTVAGQAGNKVQEKREIRQENASQNNAAERQLTKMMLTLFAVYTACCMPVTIMVLISSQVPSEAFLVGQVLMALNGALNPIVYGFMNKNIRQGYKHIWSRIISFITPSK